MIHSGDNLQMKFTGSGLCACVYVVSIDLQVKMIFYSEAIVQPWSDQATTQQHRAGAHLLAWLVILLDTNVTHGNAMGTTRR